MVGSRSKKDKKTIGSGYNLTTILIQPKCVNMPGGNSWGGDKAVEFTGYEERILGMFSCCTDLPRADV